MWLPKSLKPTAVTVTACVSETREDDDDDDTVHISLWSASI